MMRQFYLDVIVPSVSEMLSDFVRDNIVLVILLLVVILTIAVSAVNICILRKNQKNHPQEQDSTDSEDL